MFKSFDERSHQLERLDTGDYTKAEYTKWQREMRFINGLLGDTRALRLSIDGELPQWSRNQISILDVAAGAGDLLRTVRMGMRDKRVFLVGAELNPEAARSIAQHEGVSAVRCDGLKLPFAEDSFDFVVSSLFLHHLSDQNARTLIREMSRVASRKFFIIDLHRHRAAYYLYKIFGPLALQRFTVEDGSLSIRRSFRPAELKRLAADAGIRDAAVHRRAAFRLVLSGSKGDSK